MIRSCCLLLAGVLLCARAQATPPLDAYGRLPAVEQMNLSPNGERYAFVALHRESRRLGVAGFDNKLQFQALVGDQKVRDLRWASDRHVLLTYSATVNVPFTRGHTYELSGVTIVDPDSGSSEIIFRNARNISSTVVGDYGSALIDGRWYGFFGGYGAGDYHEDLYRVDLDSGKARLVEAGTDHHDGWVVSASGEVIATSRYVGTEGRWQLRAGPGRGRPLMDETAPLGGIELVGLGRRPDSVLVIDTAGDEDVLFEIALGSGKRTRLLDAYNVEGLLFDDRSRLLVGARIAEQPGAILFDDRLQTRFDATRKAFPGLQMQLVSATQDFGRLAVRTDGGDDSGTYWLVDIATGKANPVGYAYPQIRAADVGPTRMYAYKATDGLPIEGVLTLPPGRKPQRLPLVVMPHGGPIGVHDRLGFDWWAQAYASRGYAVLQPNYRGSSGYGRAFLRAGFGEYGGKMLTDIADGVAALAADGVIDAGRVCIVGASYGGYAALAGVTLQNGLYRCAVSVNGVSDEAAFLSWLSRRQGYRSAATRFLRAATGADQKGGPSLRDISPIRHAERADAPILLLHGKDDTVVPAEQSVNMAAALRRADKPVELVTMKNEDHWLSRESTRLEMLDASVTFVIEHNPPD